MNLAELKEYRITYQGLIAEAARTLGWSSKDLLDHAASLAVYYQGRGESLPESWCSAAQEAITVEQESRNS